MDGAVGDTVALGKLADAISKGSITPMAVSLIGDHPRCNGLIPGPIRRENVPDLIVREFRDAPALHGDPRRRGARDQ